MTTTSPVPMVLNLATVTNGLSANVVTPQVDLNAVIDLIVSHLRILEGENFEKAIEAVIKEVPLKKWNKLNVIVAKVKKEKDRLKSLESPGIRGFFSAGKQTKSAVGSSSNRSANPRFLPFQLSENQTMAQTVPTWVKNRFANNTTFDSSMLDQNANTLYIAELRSGYKPNRVMKKRSVPEITLLGDEREYFYPSSNLLRIKHLQFHDNVRPAYHGTWSKQSKQVTGRKPFTRDTKHLNYEVDSDEEWEEGGDGESLASDSGSEHEADEVYEIDNDLFVPHGYLSDDENKEKCIENVDEKSCPLVKETVLMAERNKSFQKTLVPIVIGCFWEAKKDLNKISERDLKMLKLHRRVSLKNK